MTFLGVGFGANADTLSCADANLEALLRFAGVTDTLTPLAAPCTARFDAAGELVLRPVELGQWVARSTGLSVARERASTASQTLALAAEVVQSGRPALVHADAHSVPWNPYFEHEHHAHAFVVDGVDTSQVHIVDSYTNATRYGNAAPTARWVALNDLRDALRPPPNDPYVVEHLDGSTHGAPASLVREIVAANVDTWAQARAEGRGLGALMGRADADGIAALNLAIWLLCRSRRAHLRWWRAGGADGGDTVDADDAVEAWSSAQTIAYIAWRRVLVGKPCPPGVADALATAAEADARWFGRMADWLQEA